MPKYIKHTHCELCGESYPTKQEADDCFWSHSELEILRWVACELVICHHFANGNSPQCIDAMMFSPEFIQKLNERFHVAEIDENGCVWSLAVKGKRL